MSDIFTKKEDLQKAVDELLSKDLSLDAKLNFYLCYLGQVNLFNVLDTYFEEFTKLNGKMVDMSFNSIRKKEICEPFNEYSKDMNGIEDHRSKIHDLYPIVKRFEKYHLRTSNVVKYLPLILTLVLALSALQLGYIENIVRGIGPVWFLICYTIFMAFLQYAISKWIEKLIGNYMIKSFWETTRELIDTYNIIIPEWSSIFNKYKQYIV